MRDRFVRSIRSSFVHLLMVGGICAVATASANDLTWFDGKHLREQARVVLEEMQSAESYGLDSARYALEVPAADVTRALADASDDQQRERFDAALSAAVARFLVDVRYGRVSPEAVGFHLPKIRDTFDAQQVVAQLAKTADVRAAIAAIEPSALPYRRLKDALSRYRTLSERDDLASLGAPRTRAIHTGDIYDDGAKLRTMLIAFGDLEPGGCEIPQPTLFDECLSTAVRHFQKRHGLVEDGILGPRTIAALNVPAEKRVRQIELTMERWRWTSALQKPDIFVNVPQFVLYALPRRQHHESDVLEMRVIVGQSAAQMRTPIFADEIEYVIFQPFWDVPASITRRELLPLIRKDPSYLKRNDMEIVRGWSERASALEPTPENLDKLEAGELRLRQRPSPKNALGSIKFMLPNPHNVYLHATPNNQLFETARRAYSHGCIRISEPALLAEYVLKSAADEWSAERIQTALCDPATRRVDLKTPVRVLIFYGTAVVTAADGAMFFEDIYGHDERLDRLLRRVSGSRGSK